MTTDQEKGTGLPFSVPGVFFLFKSFHSQLPFASSLVPTENSRYGRRGALKAHNSNQVPMGQFFFSFKATLIVFKTPEVSGQSHRGSRQWAGEPRVLDFKPAFAPYWPHHFSKLWAVLSHSFVTFKKETTTTMDLRGFFGGLRVQMQ